MEQIVSFVEREALTFAVELGMAGPLPPPKGKGKPLPRPHPARLIRQIRGTNPSPQPWGKATHFDILPRLKSGDSYGAHPGI